LIVIAGEALVDMVGDTQYRYRALAGGSCFNVAMAIGRLGLEVGFACPMSSDALGRMLSKTLTDSGATIMLPEAVPEPTPMAVVSIDSSGQPTYAFYREKTADRTIRSQDLIAALPPSTWLFHVGSVALTQKSDGDEWKAGALAARDRGALISLDPNVRPSLITDIDDYRSRMAEFFTIADLIKISDEDLAEIYPGVDPHTAFAGLVEQYSPALAILTLGDQGSIGISASGARAEQAATIPGPIVDTIGAGDSLQAGLVAALYSGGHTTGSALAALSESDIGRALVIGSLAAGLNCTRQGCSPPWRDELTSGLVDLGVSLD
jgi:fructokinase